MKRLVIVFLTIALLAALVSGCGGKEELVTPPLPSDDVPVVVHTSKPTEAPADLPSAAPTATPSGLNAGFKRGVISDDGKTYTSEYAGLSFTLPESWNFGTDEELANMMDIGVETMDMDEMSVEYAKLSTIYDMMATKSDAGANVIVMFENMTAYAGGSALSAEDYLENLKTMMLQVTSIKYEFMGFGEAELCGEDYITLAMSVEEYGITQTYYVRKLDKYMLAICFTCGDDVSLESLTSAFSD